MKFSDIDFSALSQMMNNMSDEQKDQLNDMAQNMMNNMKGNEAEEDVEDFYEFLSIEEEDYNDLPGSVLDQIEAACDLEQFYEDDKEADFSASILFYAKAVLGLLRSLHYPIYSEVFELPQFSNANTTIINQYLFPLMDETNIHKLVDAGYSTSEQWVFLKETLQQVSILLSRAEYDFVRYEDLQTIKERLIKDQALLQIKTML